MPTVPSTAPITINVRSVVPVPPRPNIEIEMDPDSAEWLLYQLYRSVGGSGRTGIMLEKLENVLGIDRANARNLR